MFSLLVRMAWEEHMEKKQHTTASGEDYLEAILVLQKKLGMVRSVDVARHMEVSKPSVCHAVATLRDGGFLTMDEDHFLHLTDVGREVAEKIYERHCFFTEQLIAAGVDPKTAVLRMLALLLVVFSGISPNGVAHRLRFASPINQ